MKIFTIGFTQKSAREFFNKIKNNNIIIGNISIVYFVINTIFPVKANNAVIKTTLSAIKVSPFAFLAPLMIPITPNSVGNKIRTIKSKFLL